MIYVTHDQVEAMTLADKIVVLEAGKVRQVGSPLQLYHMPDNQFVAGFIGSPKMNFIHAEAVSASPAGVVIKSPEIGETLIPVNPGNTKAGDKLVLGIRPEDMEAGSKGEVVLTGTVELVERLGHETFVEVQTKGGATATALISGTTIVEVGETLSLFFNASDCHLFDAAEEALPRLKVPEIAHFKRAG